MIKTTRRSFCTALAVSLSVLAACNSEKGTDAGVVVPDGGLDAGMIDGGATDGGDGGRIDDGGVDAGIDAGVDAGIDAGVDAGIDAGVDAGVDAGTDAGPSLVFVEIPGPRGLTANGSTALLQDFNSATNDVYFYDTATATLTKETSTGDFQRPVTGIAGDGSRIVGFYGTPIGAGIWSPAQGWTILGTVFDAGCDPDQGAGWALDDDGKVAVGLLWDSCSSRAFRWSDATDAGTDAGTFTLLASLSGDDAGSDRASVISADGKVMAGFCQTASLDRTPAVWHADGTGLLLDQVQAAPGEVLSISADGTMVAGILNLEGFIWTLDGGMINIGKLPGAFPTDSTYLNAIADNGQLVFGGCGDPFGSGVQAIVWTADGGMRTLQDLVVDAGLSIPNGYVLSNVIAASRDGTLLLGESVDATMVSRSFVLRLPVSTYGL
jgi:uncharacterized membrane protein